MCDNVWTIELYRSWLPRGSFRPSRRQVPSIHRDSQRDLIWSNSVKQFAHSVNDICISNEGGCQRCRMYGSVLSNDPLRPVEHRIQERMKCLCK